MNLAIIIPEAGLKFLTFCNECNWEEETIGLPYFYCQRCEHVNIGFIKIRS